MPNPAAYRNATWEHLQSSLDHRRRAVLHALRTHGPCTTRALATAMGWDILSVRPRVTELLQAGWVQALDLPGREGTYRALTDSEAIAARQQATGGHTQLDIPNIP